MLTAFTFYYQMILVLVFSCSAICKNIEEIADLNKGLNSTNDYKDLLKILHPHRDGETISLAKEDFKDNLKYDVEILEPYDIRKENEELEERYRAPSIISNTNKIFDKNIEVFTAVDEKESIEEIVGENHLISTLLIVITSLTIVLCIVFIVRRSHFQERYGGSELLITNDNRDYWSQQFTTTS
uniref:Uncharacterized protein n=1 Tax=Glossina brevipalpis TaxID=37001 RepID=A0A1A9W6M2_9MUSC